MALSTRVATHAAGLVAAIVLGRPVPHTLLLTLKRQRVARFVEVELELLGLYPSTRKADAAELGS